MSEKPRDESIDDNDQDETFDHPPPEDAEQIRSESQTAQDREHTIRGGDNRTAITKEFPT
jgi:hypothetical protein